MDVLRTQVVYEFGGFRLDLGQRVLVQPDGERVRLTARVFETLLYLVERRGELIDKDRLISAVWPNVVVEENSLSQAISALRRALGDSRAEPRFIVTESGRGYRFVAEVTTLLPQDGPAMPRAPVGAPLLPAATLRVPAARRPFVSRRVAIAAGALVLLAVAAGAGFAFLGSRPRALTLPSEYVQLTNFADSATAPALSPDGSRLAFIRGSTAFLGAGEIYVKLLPNDEPVRLTAEPRPIYGPTFTPDGTRVAYTVVEGVRDAPAWNTWAVPVTGGAPSRLLPNAAGLTWVGEHVVLYSEIETGLHMGIVSATEARDAHRAIYFPEHERAMAHYSYASPDRNEILVVEMDRSARWQPCRLVPFDGRDPGRQVGPRGACTAAAWSPDGGWMYFGAEVDGQSHLWRQKYPHGEPEQITFGPSQEEGLAVTPDGRALITSLGIEQSTIWLHDERGERQLTAEGFASAPRLSPDGTRLYYLVRSGSMPSSYAFWAPNRAELWSMELASGNREPLLTGLAVVEYAISAHGADVVFSTVDDAGQAQIWLAPLDRHSPPRLLVASGDQPAFGADGEVLYRALDATANHLERIGVDGSGRERVLDTPILNFLGASPDGSSLVVLVGHGDGAETLVLNASGEVSTRVGRGLHPSRWSADDRYFYATVSEPTAGGPGRTLVVTLPPRGTLADVSRDLDLGLGDEGPTVGGLPQARLLEPAVASPGPEPATYVFVKPDRKRNLFRIPLHGGG